MTRIWRIYKATGKCGRAYVGVTTQTVQKRWEQHIRDARNGAPYLLHRAIRKYGTGWFSVEELTVCFSKREAIVCEKALIAAHDTYAHAKNGFNLTYGGDGNWGWKPTLETRKKIGAKSAERLAANPEYVQRMIAARTGPPPVTQKKRDRAAAMGRAKKGIKLSDEHRAKISAAGVGRVKSPETIKKMKALRPKGKWKPPQEWVEKMRITKTGKKLSPENADRVTAILNNNRWKSLTPESLKKRSDSQKKVWSDPVKKMERKARQNTPEFRKKLSDGVRRANENMSEETRKLRRDVMARNNRDPKIKHRQWCARQYEKALAARIGYERPYRPRGERRRNIQAA